MKQIIIISFLGSVIWFGCANSNKKKDDVKREIEFSSKIEDTIFNKAFITKDELFQLDSVSLSQFWEDFQKNISSKNKNKIIAVLEFPIHAIHPVLFQYAHDCDTALYIKNEIKYKNIDVDSSNTDKYFDFIFSDVLKDIISQTSAKDLMKNGIRYKHSEGLTYEFFPKKYNVKVNCPNDHLLMFYFKHEAKGWRIGIGGL